MNYKQFVKERDEMLMKRDIGELRKFVAAHADEYGEEIARQVADAGDSFLKLVLHKTIISATSLPKDVREDSEAWLRDRRSEG